MPDHQWKIYEELTRDIVDRLAATTGIQTTKLVRNTNLQGHSTSNQIDVLWEFMDANALLVSVLFECRSHAYTIKQQALHACGAWWTTSLRLTCQLLE